MTGAHRLPIPPPESATTSAPIDEDAILRRHLAGACDGINIFRRAARAAARERASTAAKVEIDSLKARAVRHTFPPAGELAGDDPAAIGSAILNALDRTHLRSLESIGLRVTLVSVDAHQATLALHLPGESVVPAVVGMAAFERATPVEVAGVYTTVVCSQILAAVRIAMAAAPTLRSIRAVAVRPVTIVGGRRRHASLVAVTFNRERLTNINWAVVDAADVVAEAGTDLIINLDAETKRLEPVPFWKAPGLVAVLAAVDAAG